MDRLPFIVFAIVIVIFFVFVSIFAHYFKIWIRALMSGASVSIGSLIGMSLRKVPANGIVNARIQLVKAGIQLDTNALEAHFLAGGDVGQVVSALIAADKAGIPLTFQNACAINLAGRDVHAAVQTSVNPKVIDCPAASGPRATIDAVAKDGIQLKCKARVTVRTNIGRLVGGATEETIIARVGQGIVSTIGSSADHKQVLENPDAISKTVMASGLDAGTAFEILSIDIADIDVGENVGAKLQTEQAEADKKIAQAMAEMRRAAAVALEQEMSARTQEMRAKVVEAEALVPLAIAEAFRNGQLGVMDYAKYKNVLADTDMRSKIAGDSPGSK